MRSRAVATSTSSGWSKPGASIACALEKAEAPHRSHTAPSARLRGMATKLVANARGGSFLLELLHLAGCKRQVGESERARTGASRGEVELEVTGASFAEAAGTVFARAMRSNHCHRG